MISEVYGKYFQKSKSFLYPALGISKNSFRPTQTYLSLNDEYHETDQKLTCLFNHELNPKYEKFERELLIRSPLYYDSIIVSGKPSIYIFDYTRYSEDWQLFLEGKYSKLSNTFKRIIRQYYGQTTKEYKYIDTYLYPHNYYDLYSKLLDVDKSILIKNVELCNPYDAHKEHLKYPIFEPNPLITK